MKKLIVSAVIIGAVVFSACNKNQAAVKKLEGDWETVSEDGTTIPESERSTVNFEKCKLKKDTWCKTTSTDPDGTSYESDYRIMDDGLTFQNSISDTSKGFSFTLSGTILELTKDRFEVEFDYSEFGGDKSVTVMEKKD